MSHDVATLRSRLEAYRALVQRDGPVPALTSLVALLESELAPSNDDAAPEESRSPGTARGSR